MPSYKAPVRETRFILDEVLDIGRYSNLPGFAKPRRTWWRRSSRKLAASASEVLQPLEPDR